MRGSGSSSAVLLRLAHPGEGPRQLLPSAWTVLPVALLLPELLVLCSSGATRVPRNLGRGRCWMRDPSLDLQRTLGTPMPTAEDVGTQMGSRVVRPHPGTQLRPPGPAWISSEGSPVSLLGLPFLDLRPETTGLCSFHLHRPLGGSGRKDQELWGQKGDPGTHHIVAQMLGPCVSSALACGPSGSW